MIGVNESLKKAAASSGLKRVRYVEKNVPTSIENVVVFVFFGDHRSNFVLSSILLKRIKEESKSSKYFILISWPGNEGIFPFVDEYWEMESESSLFKLKNEVSGFSNNSTAFTFLLKSLNQYFYNVMTDQDLVSFYDNGIKKEFFERFKHIKVTLPSIPSVASVGLDLARKMDSVQAKVFIYPSKKLLSWGAGSISYDDAPREFWVSLVNYLIENKFYPVIYNDLFSYDLSEDFSEKCIHISNIDLIKVLSIMRSSGCVVDFFNGISRYAILARTPFVCFEERLKFNSIKDYEINDLCAKRINKEYIFGFSTIIKNGDESLWKSNFYNFLILKIKKLYEKNTDTKLSTTEIDQIVPYDSVRKIKNKKLGSRFIKIEKN